MSSQDVLNTSWGKPQKINKTTTAYGVSKQWVVKDLIETNIRQRGDISSSSLKMGRIIVELEKIYNIKHGNNQRTSTLSTCGKGYEKMNELAPFTNSMQSINNKATAYVCEKGACNKPIIDANELKKLLI